MAQVVETHGTWACSVCTLLNPISAVACNACACPPDFVPMNIAATHSSRHSRRTPTTYLLTQSSVTHNNKANQRHGVVSESKHHLHATTMQRPRLHSRPVGYKPRNGNPSAAAGRSRDDTPVAATSMGVTSTSTRPATGVAAPPATAVRKQVPKSLTVLWDIENVRLSLNFSVVKQELARLHSWLVSKFGSTTPGQSLQQTFFHTPRSAPHPHVQSMLGRMQWESCNALSSKPEAADKKMKDRIAALCEKWRKEAEGKAVGHSVATLVLITGDSDFTTEINLANQAGAEVHVLRHQLQQGEHPWLEQFAQTTTYWEDVVAPAGTSAVHAHGHRVGVVDESKQRYGVDSVPQHMHRPHSVHHRSFHRRQQLCTQNAPSQHRAQRCASGARHPRDMPPRGGVHTRAHPPLHPRVVMLDRACETQRQHVDQHTIRCKFGAACRFHVNGQCRYQHV